MLVHIPRQKCRAFLCSNENNGFKFPILPGRSKKRHPGQLRPGIFFTSLKCLLPNPCILRLYYKEGRRRYFNLNKGCSECQVLSSTRLYKGDIFPFPGTPACGTGRSHPPFPAHPRRHAPVTFYKRLWAAPAARPPFCKV